jgi:hypothetical protein
MRLQLITPPVFQMTGVLTTGSTAVSNLAVVGGNPNPAMVYLPFAGQPVSGAAIPAGTTVASVTDATDIVLSQEATASGSAMLRFGTEPVTLEEALTQIRFEIPSTDPVFATETSLVHRLIAAARRHCETRLRSALITQTWILYLDSFPSAGGYYNRAIREVWPSLGSLPSGLGFYPGMVPNSTGEIDIPLPPLQKIVSLTFFDFQNNLQTVDPATYNTSVGTPGRIQPVYSTVWPISRPTIDSVMITFTAGYGPLEVNVPESVQVAMKFLIGHWYENREAVAATGYAAVPDTVDLLLGIDDPGIYA